MTQRTIQPCAHVGKTTVATEQLRIDYDAICHSPYPFFPSGHSV